MECRREFESRCNRVTLMSAGSPGDFCRLTLAQSFLRHVTPRLDNVKGPAGLKAPIAQRASRSRRTGALHGYCDEVLCLMPRGNDTDPRVASSVYQRTQAHTSDSLANHLEAVPGRQISSRTPTDLQGADLLENAVIGQERRDFAPPQRGSEDSCASCYH